MGLWRSRRGPLPAGAWRANAVPVDGLVNSLAQETDTEVPVQGDLPNLVGTLYRNGPGLFDRGGERKRMVLDGDGLIDAVHLDGKTVRFRSRFVRTDKYVAEDKAQRFLHRTWSTQAPGGMLRNWGVDNLANQAGICVYRRGNALYAFDEHAQPWELDAETLQTRGMSTLGALPRNAAFHAHSKIAGQDGTWYLFTVHYGRAPKLVLTNVALDGRVSTQSVPLPRQVYFHDFLSTPRYGIFILHPAELSMGGALKAALGLGTFAEAISWQPHKGNLVLVVDRDYPHRPQLFEAPAAWMWHGVNAYEDNGDIVADFVASAENQLAPDAALFTAMQGDAQMTPQPHAQVRRYRIDLVRRRLREEILASDSGYEMPTVHASVACGKHRYSYHARAGQAKVLWSSVARLDHETGAVNVFDFGANKFCCEPICVTAPGDDETDGWVLTEVYDAASRCTSIVILRAARLADGPVATATLTHHVPLRFHGCWSGA